MTGTRTSEVLHDWREGTHGITTVQVNVGPDGRAGRDAILFWIGTERGEETKAALRAARIAWRVALAVTGTRAEDPPEDLFFATHVQVDTDSTLPGFALTHAFWTAISKATGRSPPCAVTPAEIDAAADAILRAAAGRALLPATGSVAICHGSEFEDQAEDEDHLATTIAIWDSSWTSHEHPEEGPLLDALTALSVAKHLTRNRREPGSGHNHLDIPASATMRAVYGPTLAKAAPANAGIAAAFLRKVGLPEEAEAFLATYGRTGLSAPR